MKTPALDKIMQHTLLVALESIRLQETNPYYESNPCDPSLIIDSLNNVDRRYDNGNGIKTSRTL